MLIVSLVIGFFLGAGAVWLWAREALRRSDDLRSTIEFSQERWSEQLNTITSAAVTQSQTSLLELTEMKLAPIKETLEKFERQSKELESTRQRSVAAVGEQLRAVAEGQEKLRAETGNLVTALRAPHVRGRWGEVQLKRVVELAGMVAHCDFVEQVSRRDDDGNLLRPDLVVRLPGGRSIVVDSKVPLDAYLAAIESDDAEQRRAHLERHAGQVRDHITKLGQKRYWQQFERSPEFVVMFIDEGLFRAALDQDPGLFEASAESRVVIASPATLIALLRTVSFGWQQETVAESARVVSGLGRELYERVGVFVKHFGRVGKSLDSAVGAYNDAAKSLETRLLVTARKFPEHGITADELPDVAQVERTAVVVAAADPAPYDGLAASSAAGADPATDGAIVLRPREIEAA